MQRFIQHKVDVEDPGARGKHKHGASLQHAPVDLSATNVFFIGPRASGKTTLARAVALELGLVCVDTDELVQKTSGKSIASVVQDHGWEAFRDLEHKVLEQVCAQAGQAVATGGGIILREDNREIMRSTGWVFYLLAQPDVLQARLAEQNDEAWRPSLSGMSPDTEAGQIMAEREPLYLQTLHYILPADREVAELVQDVQERLGVIGGSYRVL
ncbi:MAG: shikimate kinase AroL [Desulfovermiculus sp.]